MLDAVLQDLRYGARIIRRSPLLTALVVLTLAIGIGANTAIFSVVQAVLLRALPYKDPARLALTFDEPVHNQESKIFVPYRHFTEWNKRNHSYTKMAAETWIRGPRFLLARGGSQSILAVLVTEDFFSVFGVAPQLGTTFSTRDVGQGCRVVLSHHFWQNQLGGTRNVLGRSLDLDESTCSVVGVMPAEFVFFPAPSDMWILIQPGSELDHNPERNGVAVIGRLKPGVSRERAEAELLSVARSIDNGRAFGVDVQPVTFDMQQELTWLTGRNLRLSLLVLLGAVACVLLIACVNVANLLMGRSLSRQREYALRIAMGASQRRLMGQLFAESALLSSTGALLGIALTAGAIRVFSHTNPVELPPGATLQLNGFVFAFTAGLAVLTTVLFGFLPAWRASRTAPSDALKAGSRSSADRLSNQWAKTLIVAEVTLSVVLLAGAGLLIQSMAKFASASLGFRPERLMTLTLNLSSRVSDKTKEYLGFYERVRNRLEAFPAIESVGITSHMALKGSFGVSALDVEGRPAANPKNMDLDTESQSVSRGYFHALGIALQNGRDFDTVDSEGTEPVAIVNRALVKRYFRDEIPLGKHVRFPGDANPWLTIVGVVGDEKQSTPFHEMAWVDPPIVYRPIAQSAPPSADLIIRLSSLHSFTLAALQKEVQSISSELRISDVHPVQEEVQRYTAYPWFRAVLMGSFAGLALLLACVGIYGVLSQSVAQRTQEIGIRLALGAQVRDVIHLILKEGLLLTGLGVGIGLVATVALTRFLQSLLFEIEPYDPFTLVATVVTLAIAAVLAAYFPARRATRVDPIESLHAE